jgi:integrase
VAAADAEHPSLAAVVKLLLLTGARRSEITRAKWEYIDWKNHTLLVPRAKSGKPRLIALNASALDLLRSLPRTHSSIVFPSATMRHDFLLYEVWHRIRCRAGLPGLRLHDLRHSFASFLVNRGASLYVVQNLLGHSNPSMTQRYAHLVPATLLNAAELVGEVVGEAMEGANNTAPSPSTSGLRKAALLLTDAIPRGGGQ